MVFFRTKVAKYTKGLIKHYPEKQSARQIINDYGKKS